MRIENAGGERQGNGLEEGMKGDISTTSWRNWRSKTQRNITKDMMRMSHADFQRMLSYIEQYNTRKQVLFGNKGISPKERLALWLSDFKIVRRALHRRMSWSKYYRPDVLQPHPKLSCFATGAIGSISNGAKTWFGKLDLPEFFGSVQLSAILGNAHPCCWKCCVSKLRGIAETQ